MIKKCLFILVSLYIVSGTPALASAEMKRTIQYVEFRLNPPIANATVKFKGDKEEYYTEADGRIACLKSFGQYTYTVTAKDYYPVTDTIVVNNPNDEHIVNVDLKPAFGYLNIVSDAKYYGAKVFADEEFRGTIPSTHQLRLSKGKHTIKIEKDLYETSYQELVIGEDGSNTDLEVSMNIRYVEMTIQMAYNSRAQIYLDNQLLGYDSVTTKVGYGDHIFTAKQDAHQPSELKMIVSAQTPNKLTLDAPKPIYGSLNITSTPKDADIYIDGNKIPQTTPAVVDVLMGSHTVFVKKEDDESASQTVKVKDSETKSVELTIEERLDVRFECNYINTKLYIDGDYVGTMPLTVTLKTGIHRIKASNSYTTEEYNDLFNVSVSSQSKFIAIPLPKDTYCKNQNKYSIRDMFYDTSGKYTMSLLGLGLYAGTEIGMELSVLSFRFGMFEINPLMGTFGGYVEKSHLMDHDGDLMARIEADSTGRGAYKYGGILSYTPSIGLHVPVKDDISLCFNGGLLLSWQKVKWKIQVQDRYGMPTTKKKSKYYSKPVWFTAEVGVDWNLSNGMSNVYFFARYQNGVFIGCAYRIGPALL